MKNKNKELDKVEREANLNSKVMRKMMDEGLTLYEFKKRYNIKKR